MVQLQLSSVLLFLSSLHSFYTVSLSAVPAGFSYVSIKNAKNDRLIAISADGNLHNSEEEITSGTCFVMFKSYPSANGLSVASFGQIVGRTSYFISALSDGTVVASTGNDEGSAEEYTEFTFNTEGLTQLGMDIDDETKCLSFTDAGPMMANCNDNYNTYFEIYDGCE